jgi:hypothetical protein
MRKEKRKGKRKGFLHMLRRLVFVFGSMLFFSACELHKHPPPTQEEAIRVVQQALAIQDPMTAQTLHGGMSGAEIFLVRVFLVTDGCQQYVVRFLPYPPKREPEEITCLRIASTAGYGPHLYAVAPDWSWVVMEYVQSQPVTHEDRSTGLFYRQLGEVVSKMHHGPSFPARRTILETTAHGIRRIKKRPSLASLSAHLEQTLSIIQEAVRPVSQKAPCHDDLYPNNTIWTGSTCKIIDYGDARQDDPYFDVASVLQFNCFCDEAENGVVTAYFGGPPTKEERVHLYLMKQAVRIVWTVRLLMTVPDGVLEKNIVPSSLEDLLNALETGEQSAEDPETRYAIALSLLSQLNQDYNSEAFQKAIKTLTSRSTAPAVREY